MSLRIRPLSDFEAEKTLWLWPGRIPCGCITILDGDPGVNKSSLTYDIAARVSSGRPMPGCRDCSPPGAVILLQDEDSVATMRANLGAAGGDLDRVFLIDKNHLFGDGILIPDCLEFLEREIANTRAKLLVIDPLTAYLAGNANSDQSVRKALGPLAAMAQRMGVAVILVRHLRKTGGSNPLYRGAGSIGVIAAARSGLLVARDPADPEQRVLAQTKSSFSAPAESLAFKPVVRGTGLAIEWLGTSNYSAEELLEVGKSQTGSELQEAVYVLYSALAEGPVQANFVKHIATDAGIAPRTLRRAKAVLRVQSKRRGFGPRSQFYWVMPKDDEIVQRLRDNDMQDLADRLFHGTDADDIGDITSGPHVGPEHEEHDPADWWKQGPGDDEDEDGDGDGHVPTR